MEEVQGQQCNQLMCEFTPKSEIHIFPPTSGASTVFCCQLQRFEDLSNMIKLHSAHGATVMFLFPRNHDQVTM